MMSVLRIALMGFSKWSPSLPWEMMKKPKAKPMTRKMKLMRLRKKRFPMGHESTPVEQINPSACTLVIKNSNQKSFQIQTNDL